MEDSLNRDIAEVSFINVNDGTLGSSLSWKERYDSTVPSGSLSWAKRFRIFI